MRIALIRGSLQRAWELPAYEFGHGHQVDLFISRRLRLDARPAAFRERRLPTLSDAVATLGPRARGAIDLAAGSLEYLVGLERALAGYDVAHAAELDNPLTLQAIRARRSGRCRRVVATVFENIPFRPAQNALVARRLAKVASGADAFLAVTERARLHLLAAGAPDERIVVLPFGVDVDRFRPAEAREPGPPRVLSVCRLEPAKGVEDLVIAVGLLARRGVHVELSLVGDGPLRPRLERIARAMGITGQVRFRAVPWAAIAAVYREADVFVLASTPTRNWREQFGFAVVEAMASGLPVLVGASGSLPEVVGREDQLVAPADPLGLADRLGELVRDAEARERLGAANRARAVERFDSRRTQRNLLAAYERVLAAPPAP